VRRVRRFACALACSLALHATALVSASKVGLFAPPPFQLAAEPLVLLLGPLGQSTHGGGAVGAKAPEKPAIPAPSSPSAPADTKVDGERVSSVRPVRRAGPVSTTAVEPSVRQASARVSAPARATPVPIDDVDNEGAGSQQGSAGGGAGERGPAAGGSGTSGPLTVAYEQTLAAWLNTHKYYPASLRRRGIEGEGKLRIRIARSGHVLSVDIAAAFPHPSLEAISEDWVKRAEPFPPVPAAIPGDNYVFVVPVGFRLQ
jgi:protein TonB